MAQILSKISIVKHEALRRAPVGVSLRKDGSTWHDNPKKVLLMDSPQETTLAKVRLHWGIFIPTLLIALGPILACLPFIFMVHELVNGWSQMLMPFGGSPGIPSLNHIWLLVLIPCFGADVCLFLGTWFSYAKSEITLTNRGLVFRTGFLSRHSGELPLENVESIYITEPLLGRLCGFGTVTVTTVGGAAFPLRFIGSPQHFHSELQTAVLNAKNFIRQNPRSPESGAPPHDDNSRYMPKT